MPESSRSKLINDNPIGNGLDAFLVSFDTICNSTGTRSADKIDRLGREDAQDLAFSLLSALQILPVSRHLQSKSGSGTVRNELLKLVSAVASDKFDFSRVKPLLKAALTNEHDDILIWDLVSAAAVESTPPPRTMPSSIQQTPLSQNTSGLVNSSELRKSLDPLLKLELGHLYAGVPNFHQTFFGDVPDLHIVSKDILQKCTEGEKPLFREGWIEWPTAAQEGDVLAWLEDIVLKLEAFTGDRISAPDEQRKLLAQPKIPIVGSTGKRSMDIGFAKSDTDPGFDKRHHWSHILVAGELKSNPKADIASSAWIDLARYAREIFAAQAARRFVLGFTLCGPLMRVWEFDRLGGVASEQFNINQPDGALLFVTTILGFLRMNEVMLGLDPTIITSGDEQYVSIERNGKIERLVIDEVTKRARCVAGRATTCWKAHRKEDPQTILVIKDSWQYTDRDEEGELLREATEKGVANVARYYHHGTVRVGDADDDVQGNIRKGLEIIKAANHKQGRDALLSNPSVHRVSRHGRSVSSNLKRPSSETDVDIPWGKRTCSESPTKASIIPLPNRVHRRVILQDYGEPIYKASSPVALLDALERCIAGHKSLYKAGFLHRDISVNNLMINQDLENPSLPAFLIDLDLAIRTRREAASGAQGKTGTRAFMAIGALLGQVHSFMHDLESFFWVLFWICIHYDGPGNDIGATQFERWNYENDNDLVEFKKGVISDEEDFLNSARDNFTPHYKPLIPWVNRLRRKVFPNGERWKKPELELYELMMNVLREAKQAIETAYL